ncbi:MAG: cytochrome c peroxidase, partial [Candidatus Hydrogenedentales bacterium]
GIPEYQQLFTAAFPGVPEDELTMAHAGNAIAEFQIDAFTLVDSPFDQYLGGENDALTTQQKDGLELFFDQAGCFLCHSGPHFTDFLFHDIGVPQLGPGKGDGPDGRADFGRERVTNLAGNRYRFRTPPLRNVAATGPWGHDGAFTTLRGFVELYNDPEAAATNYDASQLEPLLQDAVVTSETPLILERLSGELPDINLTPGQIEDVVAFLNALTSPSLATLAQTVVPSGVPSGLPVTD